MPTREPTPTARHPRKTSRDAGRRWNLLTTLQTIAAHGVTSRAEVARATGLTRATVSALVADLINQDLVSEVGTADTETAGKPATLITVNGAGRVIVALDLSHQPFRAALVDLTGNRLSTVIAAATATGPEAVGIAAGLVEACLERAAAPVLGIGVGTPGMLDPDGTVREAAHLEWHGVALRQILADRFGMPVTVGNDAHVSALAEYRARADQDGALLVVTVGEGIGAGLVLDGRLHTGDRLSSGEIGHVVVDPDGHTCRCGQRGCLETVAAVPAVTTSADSTGSAAAEAGRRLGATLAVVISAIDVNRVVIASPLAEIAGYAEAVRAELIGRMHTPRRPDVTLDVTTGAELVLDGAAAALMGDALGVVLR